jgi:hypothetical protein
MRAELKAKHLLAGDWNCSSADGNAELPFLLHQA